MYRLFSEGVNSLGLFATEGGQFLGGYGMKAEHRLMTAAGLSALWDGATIRRVRAGDGAQRLAGRRLSMHLQVQPGVSEGLLADQVLIDQGLTSRVLSAAPNSTAGSRQWKEPSPEAEAFLERYSDAVTSLLRQEPRMGAEPRALNPVPLQFDGDGCRLWNAFHDEVEHELGPDGQFVSVSGFAGKLPEHAARLAAVMASVSRPEVIELTGDDLARGIDLARYYVAEALRLHDTRCTHPDLAIASRVLRWARSTGRDRFSLVNVYKDGPRAVRDAKTARRIVGVLAEHGYVNRLPKGTEIDGSPRLEAWELVKEC